MSQSVASTSTAGGATAAPRQSRKPHLDMQGVRFKHIRYYQSVPKVLSKEGEGPVLNIGLEIAPHGGTTIAYRLLGGPDSHGAYEYEYAVARCNQTDPFRKAYGRTKAAGRLSSATHRFTVKVVPQMEKRGGVEQLEDPDKALHRFFDTSKFRSVSSE